MGSSAGVWPEAARLIGKRVVLRKHGGAPEEASVWPGKWRQVGFRARPGSRGVSQWCRPVCSLLAARPRPELSRLAGPRCIPQGGSAHAREPFPGLFPFPRATLWLDLSSPFLSFPLYSMGIHPLTSRLLTVPGLTPGFEHRVSLCTPA